MSCAASCFIGTSSEPGCLSPVYTHRPIYIGATGELISNKNYTNSHSNKFIIHYYQLIRSKIKQIFNECVIRVLFMHVQLIFARGLNLICAYRTKREAIAELVYSDHKYGSLVHWHTNLWSFLLE